MRAEVWLVVHRRDWSKQPQLMVVAEALRGQLEE